MDEEHPKSIRWKQRFSNYRHALERLQEGAALKQPSDLEKEGIIQRFEFTFELAWKTLKDYMESQEIPVRFPREVIKEAFRYALLDDGECWMSMLEERNRLSHTYNEHTAHKAHQHIVADYLPQLNALKDLLEDKI